MLQKMQLVRGVGITAALALTVVVSGCGGGSSTKNYAPVAVYQFGQTSIYTTFANRGGVSSALTLSGATSVASNVKVAGGVTTGVFLIADTGNNRILGFKKVPTSTATPADFVYGQDDMASNNRSDLLNQPSKVSFSKDGTKLLVVDSGNNRVLVWDAALTNFTGTGQVPINTVVPNKVVGDGTSAISATSLSNPTGASFAPTIASPNRLVVADKGNNRVLIYNDYTTYTTVTATNPVVLGQRNQTTGVNTPNCPQSTVSVPDCTIGTGLYPYADSLRTPSDVWSDGTNMLISDSGNNRVLFFTSVPTVNEAPATSVIGQTSMIGAAGPSSGQSGLNGPQGIWTDPFTKIIYVADFNNNRVLGFNKPVQDHPLAIVVYGQGDYNHVTANDDNQDNLTDHPDNNTSIAESTDRTLASPAGMVTAVSASGANQLFVMDSGNSRMMVYTTN